MALFRSLFLPFFMSVVRYVVMSCCMYLRLCVLMYVCVSVVLSFVLYVGMSLIRCFCSYGFILYVFSYFAIPLGL